MIRKAWCINRLANTSVVFTHCKTKLKTDKLVRVAWNNRYTHNRQDKKKTAQSTRSLFYEEVIIVVLEVKETKNSKLNNRTYVTFTK